MSLSQKDFRIRRDDGSETTATWHSPLNESAEVPSTEQFRIRTVIENAGGATEEEFALQYRVFEEGGSSEPDLEANYTVSTAMNHEVRGIDINGDLIAIGAFSGPLYLYKRDGSNINQLDTGPYTNPIAPLWLGPNHVVAHTGWEIVHFYKVENEAITGLSSPTLGASQIINWHIVRGDYWIIGTWPFSGTTRLFARRRNGDSLVNLSIPNPPAAVVQIHDSGDHIIVTHEGAAGFSIYKQNGDTFTVLTHPGGPTGMCRAAGWYNDYVAIAQNSPARFFLYERSGDTFTQVGDPVSLPGQAFNFHWIEIGSEIFLIVNHDGGDCISYFKFENEEFTPLTVTDPPEADGVRISWVHENVLFVHNYLPSGDPNNQYLITPTGLEPISFTELGAPAYPYFNSSNNLLIFGANTAPRLRAYDFVEGAGGGWGEYADIPSQQTSSVPVRYADSSHLTDGEATTQQLSAGGFTAGRIYESPSNALISVGTDQTELEFVLEATAYQGTELQFRTVSGQGELTSYDGEILVQVGQPPIGLPSIDPEGANPHTTHYQNVLSRLYYPSSPVSVNKVIANEQDQSVLQDHGDGTWVVWISHGHTNSATHQRFFGIDHTGELVYLRDDGTLQPFPAVGNPLVDPFTLASEGCHMNVANGYVFFQQNDPIGSPARLARWKKGEAIDVFSYATGLGHLRNNVIHNDMFYAAAPYEIANPWPGILYKGAFDASPLVHEAGPSETLQGPTLNRGWMPHDNDWLYITGSQRYNTSNEHHSREPVLYRMRYDDVAEELDIQILVASNDQDPTIGWFDFWGEDDSFGPRHDVFSWEGVDYYTYPNFRSLFKRPWGVIFHNFLGTWTWTPPYDTNTPVRVEGPANDPFMTHVHSSVLYEHKGVIYGIHPHTDPAIRGVYYLDETTWEWIRHADIAWETMTSNRHALICPDGAIVTTNFVTGQEGEVRYWEGGEYEPPVTPVTYEATLDRALPALTGEKSGETASPPAQEYEAIVERTLPALTSEKTAEFEAQVLPFHLSPSTHLNNDPTTAQLTPPTGKTTADFSPGVATDDTNPVTVEIDQDGYTEVEFSIEATPEAINEQIYEFRVLVNGDLLEGPLPEWVINDTPVYFEASLERTLPALTSQKEATFEIPQYEASIARSLPAFTSDKLVEVEPAPAYEAEITRTLPALSSAKTATFEPYIPRDAEGLLERALPALVSTKTVTVELAPPLFQIQSSEFVTEIGEPTTAQLAAPAGQTTSDFQPGLLAAQNPVTVALEGEGYTELEWLVQASPYVENDSTYEFRVVVEDAELDTYEVYPEWHVTYEIPVSSQAVWLEGAWQSASASYWNGSMWVPLSSG